MTTDKMPGTREEVARAHAVKALDPVLTREEVARALNCSIPTLERMHARGEGPPRIKFAIQRWGYPSSKFLAWREAREQQARQ